MNVMIYGNGKTGQALKNFLKKDNCFIYDDNKEKSECSLSEIPFEKLDMLLLSPSVKINNGMVETCRKMGVNVQSEFDFCFSNCKAKIVSITGTNGKTTTSKLVFHILKKAKKKTHLVGNCGIPVSEVFSSIKDNEIVVCESSSFQLEQTKNFQPFVSVITNIHEDHLDYHGTFENYIKSKEKNYLAQKQEAFAIFNYDDLFSMRLSQKGKGKRLFFSTKNTHVDCYAKGDCVFLGKKLTQKVQFDGFSQMFEHMKSNYLVAFLVCSLFGVELQDSVEFAKDFVLDSHRVETVLIQNGVTFVNDSKGTNVHAVLSALNCFDDNVALILGGKDKGYGFDCIFEKAKNNVTFFAIGETAKKIQESGDKYGKKVVVCESLKEATTKAYESVRNLGKGVVLLSPACSSFDSFESYQHRGECFKKYVREINFKI